MTQESKDDYCPLTKQQAIELLTRQEKDIADLTSAKEDIAQSREDISKIRQDISSIKEVLYESAIKDAERVGYLKGASFWFRSGVYIAIGTLVTGIIAVAVGIVAILSGRWDLLQIIFK